MYFCGRRGGKTSLFYVCESFSGCLCTTLMLGAQGVQQRALDPLELVLQIVVSHMGAEIQTQVLLKSSHLSSLPVV